MKRTKIGIGLVVFGLIAIITALLFGIPFMEVGGVMAIMPAIKVDKSNADEEAKAFLTDLEKRLKLADFDGMTKAEIKAEVIEAIKEANKTFEGIKAEDLQKLMDAEKGAFAILKNLGVEITALKEEASKGAKSKLTFKDALNAWLGTDDMAKFIKSREEGSGRTLEIGKAAAIMTSANVVDYTALPDDLIDSFSLAGFVEKRRPREYVFDMASVTNVAEVEKYIVWEEEGDEQGAFAVVAEGALKPLTSYALVKNTSTARKVAGKYVVTEEFTKFRKNAYNIIQRLARQKMLRDYAAILTTDLLADAAPYVASALDGEYPADKVTDYHAIAAVAAQIESIDFFPDLLIMNPQDKWRIGMSQDGNGQFYLTIPITSPTGQTTMMGFNVRTSNRVPVGYFLLGESGLWEIVQESIKIKIGYGVTVTGGTDNGGGNVTNVSSDFDNNRFRVILETYFHDYIATNNAGSFVYANFDVVKALVTAV